HRGSRSLRWFRPRRILLRLARPWFPPARFRRPVLNMGARRATAYSTIHGGSYSTSRPRPMPALPGRPDVRQRLVHAIDQNQAQIAWAQTGERRVDGKEFSFDLLDPA